MVLSMLEDSEEGILPESSTTQTGDPVDGTKQMGGWEAEVRLEREAGLPSQLSPQPRQPCQ